MLTFHGNHKIVLTNMWEINGRGTINTTITITEMTAAGKKAQQST